MKRMNWSEFATRYCETQEATPEGLVETLRDRVARFTPEGFFLAECQMMDSSRLGDTIILPFGPNNTFKSVPETPFSPRGLASDTSSAIGYIAAQDVPQEG